MHAFKAQICANLRKFAQICRPEQSTITRGQALAEAMALCSHLVQQHVQQIRLRSSVNRLLEPPQQGPCGLNAPVEGIIRLLRQLHHRCIKNES